MDSSRILADFGGRGRWALQLKITKRREFFLIPGAIAYYAISCLPISYGLGLALLRVRAADGPGGIVHDPVELATLKGTSKKVFGVVVLVPAVASWRTPAHALSTKVLPLT
jgi:hypothetical protein